MDDQVNTERRDKICPRRLERRHREHERRVKWIGRSWLGLWLIVIGWSYAAPYAVAAPQSRFTSDAPEDIEVVALTGEPLPENEAFVDCCIFCRHQSLEALRAPADVGDGWRRLSPGESASRAKFCGEVVSYRVNDELDDPRDILINIRPHPDFRGFVDGFGKTQCSPNAPCIHAEITPSDQFYRQDAIFLPISGDGPCGDGGYDDCPSLLARTRAPICVYGVYAFDHGAGHRPTDHGDLGNTKDDGHDHPEIHPFDAVWWPRPAGNGYLFAVFQDDSNRYSHPYCGDQNNGNGWSQAPRDLRFRFPFSFSLSEAPVRADLRWVRTRDFDDRERAVRPLNVTTAMFTQSEERGARRRFVSNGEVIFEVVEESGMDPQTDVGIEATVDGDRVSGFVNLRLAVGCDPRDPQTDCSLASLRAASPGARHARHDAKDPGSGYFFGELSFRSAPRTAVTARLRLWPPTDPGRFDLRIDGVVRASRVGDGGSTGRQDLAPGGHRVTVTGGTGTALSDYVATIGGACSADGRIELRLGDDVTCAVTIRRRLTRSETVKCLEDCDAALEICKAAGELLPRQCVQLSNDCKARCRE